MTMHQKLFKRGLGIARKVDDIRNTEFDLSIWTALWLSVLTGSVIAVTLMVIVLKIVSCLIYR